MPRKQSGDSTSKAGSNKAVRSSSIASNDPPGGIGAVFAAAIPTPEDVTPADSFGADFPAFEEPDPAPPKAAPPRKGGRGPTAAAAAPKATPPMDDGGSSIHTDVTPTQGGGPQSDGGIPPSTVRSDAPSQNGVNNAGDDFEGLVGDLRRTFIGWLKKTELELVRQRDELHSSRQDFEDEKRRVWEQFVQERQREAAKQEEDRRRADLEMQNQLRQVEVERSDARQKMADERQRFESERDEAMYALSVQQDAYNEDKKSFDTDKNRIIDHNMANETMVTLNVGGTTFETSRQTLCQQKGSFLEALLSGRYEVPKDSDGKVFLDRDAEMFRQILNFLRNPMTPPCPRDATESMLLAREADFYGIRFFPFPLVFALGGNSGNEYLRSVEVLDLANQCWRPCRQMSTERSYFGSAVANSRVYAFGGQNLDYKALSETEVYDTLRDTWMLGASLNTPRRNCAGVSYDDGRIFALGGFDGTHILSSVEAFDPRMRNWMEVAPLSTPRSSCSAVSVDGNIWAIGGTSGSRLRTVEVYDVRANKWMPAQGCDLLEERSAGAAVNYLGNIFAFGGIDNEQDIHSTMETLRVSEVTKGWSFRASPTVNRMDCAAAVYSDKILLGGGQNGEVQTSVETYDPVSDTWMPAPPMLFPRYGHQYAVVNL